MVTKIKILICISIAIIALIPIAIKADGGVTFSVEVSQIESEINLPSQEVIIDWDGNYENMAISTGIKTKDLVDLAWIIPIPSKIKPEVEKADAELFQKVPYLFSEIKRMERSKSSGLGLLIILFLPVLIFISLLFQEKRNIRSLIVWSFFILVWIFIFGSIILVSLGGARGGIGTEVSPIEVIETKKVGVYDIVILKATDAEYMVNWLNEQGYKISKENIPILQDYCNQPNFYFIVNKINKETLDKKDLLEGIATPLKIRFQPEQPFYPLRMSSINGGETLINVYVFSDEPFRDESGILSIRKSRDIRTTRDIIMRSRNQEAKEAVNYLVYSMSDDYHFATWLDYKGDLKDLYKDAYFKFDSITCESLPEEKVDLFDIEVTKSRCYQLLALSTSNPSLCEKITNQSLRDECYWTFGFKNPSFCEKILSEETKHSCYTHFALNVAELSQCQEKAPSPYSKDVCFRVFAERTNDPSLCEKITVQEEKEDCYYEVAIKIKNASFCEEVIDQIKKGNCYRIIAVSTKNPSLCEGITDQKQKDECYYIIASDTKNVSLCESIASQYLKDLCYKRVQ